MSVKVEGIWVQAVEQSLPRCTHRLSASSTCHQVTKPNQSSPLVAGGVKRPLKFVRFVAVAEEPPHFLREGLRESGKRSLGYCYRLIATASGDRLDALDGKLDVSGRGVRDLRVTGSLRHLAETA